MQRAPVPTRRPLRPFVVASTLSSALFVACGDDAVTDGSDASTSPPDASVIDAAVATETDGGSVVDAATPGDAPVHDAAPDADPQLDAAPGPCADGAAACPLADGGAGLCKAGQCVACDEALDQASCASAYADAGPRACVGGACVPAACSVDVPCAAGGGCSLGQCVACDAPSNHVYVVDPAKGSLGATGSATSSGASTPSCAMRTLNEAIAAIAAAAGDGGVAPPGTKIVLRGPTFVTPGAHEPYPIWLPANVTLEGESGAGIAALSGVTAVGVATQGVVVRKLTIDGLTTSATSPIGITVQESSSLTLEDVDLRRCARGVVAYGAIKILPGTKIREMVGDGVFASLTADVKIDATSAGGHVELRDNGENAVHASAGTLSIIGGLTAIDIQNNVGRGVFAHGTASVAIDGGAAPITFQGNGTGIYVSENASLKVRGDAALRNVVVLSNGSANAGGLWLRAGIGSSVPTADVEGLVAEEHVFAGVIVETGSKLRLRESRVVGNQHGVVVMPGYTTGGALRGAAGIDLGTDVAGEAGKNILQDVTKPNTGAGICVLLPASAAQTVEARGNTLVSGDAGVDCTTSTANVGPAAAACAGAVNVSVAPGAPGNVVRVDGCTLQ